jgi:hypothetical protein
VESRGKAIRLQHLVPVPRGESLTAIAQMLMSDLERAFAERRKRKAAASLSYGTKNSRSFCCCQPRRWR